MNKIEAIANQPQVQAAFAYFQDHLEKIVSLAIQVQQIPAPTFAEKARADFVKEQFKGCGLADVYQDEIFNVYGRLPATAAQPGRPVVISAHTDTVFNIDTDLTVQRKGRLVYGPGIGDNSTGVAGLLTIMKLLAEGNWQLNVDIWFVANVGEEGLGDLRGMRAVVEKFGADPYYIVVEGGLYGQISHQGIGVRRYRIEVKTAGGHSWGSYGNVSAIHELGKIIAEIDKLTVPKRPKTTYNVGVIAGGTSINTIAQSASLLLDLRSEDREQLRQLVKEVETVVSTVDRRTSKQDKTRVEVTMTLIGNRPAGSLAREAAIVQWAETALRAVGCPQVSYIASSTDANIPLSKGMDAICIGLTESSNAHRLDEYMDPKLLPNGLSQLLLITLAAAGF